MSAETEGNTTTVKVKNKANKALNNDEITTLVNNLRKCKNPYTCPHGRPTIISFKQTEIEKMFERIQS